MKSEHHHDQGRRLRKLAGNIKTLWKFREHALEEMRKDNISELPVKSMIKRCCVIRVEQNFFEETWNAEGSDTLGNQITAVAVAYEDELRIKVNTAWRR